MLPPPSGVKTLILATPAREVPYQDNIKLFIPALGDNYYRLLIKILFKNNAEYGLFVTVFGFRKLTAAQRSQHDGKHIP